MDVYEQLKQSYASAAPFCPRCGSLFALSDSPDLNCDTCNYRCTYSDLESLVTVTSAKPRPLPQWYMEHTGRDDGVSDRVRAKVDMDCPECKNPEMLYYTMQMRSADEGQTVFYECPKCGYKTSTNT